MVYSIEKNTIEAGIIYYFKFKQRKSYRDGVWIIIEIIYIKHSVFDHITEHLKDRQKYSAVHRIFNCFLSVWKFFRHCPSCSIHVYYISHVLKKLNKKGRFRSTEERNSLCDRGWS